MTAAGSDSRYRRLLGAERDFTLLWVGEAVSSLGSAASLVTYPLLVLAVTGRPAAAGLVFSAAMAAQLLVGLPSGALIDRVDKRLLMLTCDAVRAVGQGGLAIAIAARPGHLLIVIVALAVLDSACTAVFAAAEPTAVRHVVTSDQLPLALARIEARDAAALLAGPPLGGILFTIGHQWPFAVNALTYLASFGCLALIRTPMRATPGSTDTGSVPVGAALRAVATGLRWIWTQPFLRVTLLLIAGNNLVSNSVIIAAIVGSQRRGDAAGTTGLLVTSTGIGTLLGALLTPRLVDLISVRRILIGNRILWTLLIPPLIFIHNIYAVGAIIGLMYLIGPTGSTAIRVRQMSLTPEHMQGRASSARGFTAGLAAPIGAAGTGFVLDRYGPTAAIAGLAVLTATMAVIAAHNSSLRHYGGKVTDQKAPPDA